MTEEYIEIEDILTKHKPNITPLTKQRYCTRLLTLLRKLEIKFDYLITNPDDVIEKLVQIEKNDNNKTYENNKKILYNLNCIIKIIKWIPSNNAIRIYENVRYDIIQSGHFQKMLTNLINDFVLQ
jgi:sucrose-6-phosphate hydrolase SacC (GH32 family)